MHFMLPDEMRSTPRKFPIIDRFIYLKIEQPEWAKNDEIVRFFRHYRKSLTHGRLVLAAIVQAKNSRITTIFIPRKHLPGGHLQDKILPICVDPENGVAAVFPVKYWG